MWIELSLERLHLPFQHPHEAVLCSGKTAGFGAKKVDLTSISLLLRTWASYISSPDLFPHLYNGPNNICFAGML